MSKRLVPAYKFTILTGALILIALLLPSKTFPKVPAVFGIDKLVHACLFFLFALAFVGEYRGERKRNPGILLETTLVVPFILLSEALQLLTKTRHFELADMGADLVGAAAAILVSRIVLRLRQGSRNRGG